ncbi:MAG: hypothetical protein HIU88_10085 [Acidobacteria bacterium]|nr:hypothetical protein [Acidobacteriota bacterium]
MSVATAEALEAGTEAGVEWKVLLSPLGNCINGYARIPAGHPWAGIRDYDDIPVAVPGGLTFGPEPERNLFGRVYPARDSEGWIGFDTAHAFDWWSPLELTSVGGAPLPLSTLNSPEPYSVVWTREDVVDAARGLARQIAAATAVTA